MGFMEAGEREELASVRSDLQQLRRDVRSAARTPADASAAAAERVVVAAFRQSEERYRAEVAWLCATYALEGSDAYSPDVRAKFFGGNLRALIPGNYLLALTLNHQIPQDPERRDLARAESHVAACRDYFIKDYYYGKFFNPRAKALFAYAEELGSPLALDPTVAVRELVARRRLSSVEHQLLEMRLGRKVDAAHRNANDGQTLFLERSPYFSKTFAANVPLSADAFCQSLNVELVRFILSVLPPALVLAVGRGTASLLEQFHGVYALDDWSSHNIRADRAQKACIVRTRKYQLRHGELSDDDADDESRGTLIAVHTDFWGFRPGTGPKEEREYAAVGKSMARARRGRRFDDVLV